MPNQRAAGQVPILIPFRDEFLQLINAHYEEAGYDDRAKFIRAAVREKLIRMGYSVPVEYSLAPGRSGKGGPNRMAEDPPTGRLAQPREAPANSSSLSDAVPPKAPPNPEPDTPSYTVDEGVRILAEKVAEEVKHPGVVFLRRRKAR